MNTNLKIQKSVVLTLGFLLAAALLLISQLYPTGATATIGAGPNLYPNSRIKFNLGEAEAMAVVQQIGIRVEAYAPLGGKRLPPAALEGWRTPAALEGWRTPAALEGWRTPAALEGRKPPAALEGRKPPAALEGRKLPGAAQVAPSAQQVTPLNVVDMLVALTLAGALLSLIWQARPERI